MIVGEMALPGHAGFDAGHVFMEASLFMVDNARRAARTDAHSYRDFYVGAAGLAFNPSTQETAILSAGNLKSKSHTNKVCAERKVLQQAKKIGLTQMAGLVVAATTDSREIEDVTGAATPTLHPCPECQDLFDEHPLMRDDTVIMTTGLDVDVYQVHTHSEMTGLYAKKDTARLRQQVANGFDGWETRTAMYDFMAAGERSLEQASRRTTGKLLQIALIADLSQIPLLFK